MSEFAKNIAALMDDCRLDDVTKKGMLEVWKIKLIKNNSNRIMDKEMTEKHFEWLKILDDAISCLAIQKEKKQ